VNGMFFSYTGTVNCNVNYSVYWIAVLAHILLNVNNFMSVAGFNFFLTLTIPVVISNWKSMDVTVPFIMLSSEH